MADFEKREKLGEGNFGEVWLVFDRALGLERAVKYVAPHNITNPNEMFREAQLLANLTHPNIVPVHEAGQLADGTIYIAMDYCRRGSVESRYKGRPQPLKRARKILADVLRGLEFAHGKGILHRDIKPGNILCRSSFEYMVSDFGLATKVGAITTQKTYRYVSHLAPEVIQGGDFTEAADVYAAGVTAYRLINGDSYLVPYGSVDELKRNILQGKHPRRDCWRLFVPRRIRTLINKALEIAPRDRFGSAKEFRHGLEQVNIDCSWRELAVKDGTHWRTEERGVITEIRVSRSVAGVHTLSLHRGSTHNLRQIHSFTYSSSREDHVLNRVARITQGMAGGRGLPSLRT